MLVFSSLPAGFEERQRLILRFIHEEIHACRFLWCECAGGRAAAARVHTCFMSFGCQSEMEGGAAEGSGVAVTGSISCLAGPAKAEGRHSFVCARACIPMVGACRQQSSQQLAPPHKP